MDMRDQNKPTARNIRLALVLTGIIIIMFVVTLMWAGQYLSLPT